MPKGLFSSPAVDEEDKKLEAAIIAQAKSIYGIANPEIVLTHVNHDYEFYLALIDKDKYLAGEKGFVLNFWGLEWEEGRKMKLRSALYYLQRELAVCSDYAVCRDIERELGYNPSERGSDVEAEISDLEIIDASVEV